MKKLEIIGIFFFSILISFFLYGKSIPGEFVHDDVLITHRYELREFSSAIKTFFQPYLPFHIEAGVWRPLSTWAFDSEFILFGETPSYFHVVNIVINGINTALIFFITFILFQNRKYALLTCIIFAFLPIHSEAVASIKSLEDLLASTFFLLAWVFFLRAVATVKTSRVFLVGAGLGCFFSVLAKETFIIAPFIIVGVHAMRHWQLRRIIGLSSVFLPGTISYLLMRYMVLGSYAFGSDDASFVINPIPYFSFFQWIFTVFEMVGIYLQQIVVPMRLTTSYHYQQVPALQTMWGVIYTILGIVSVVIGLSILAIRKFRNTQIGLGIFVFLSSYIIVSKLFVTGGEFMAERWMYIPSFGIAMILGFGFYKLVVIKKHIGLIIFGLFLLFYTTTTIPRNDSWLTSRSFVLAMAKDSPQSVHAQYALGDYFLTIGDIEQARIQADKAGKIYPNYPSLLVLQGSILGFDHKYEEAEKLFLKVMEQEPNNFTTGLKLALVYIALGKNDHAVSLFDQLTLISYGRLNVHDYLFYATALIKTKEYQRSIDVIRTYVGAENLPDTRFLLAVAYYKLGDEVNALKYFDWDTTKSETQKRTIIDSF